MTPDDPRAEIGEDSVIQEGAVAGLIYRPGCGPARIGKRARVRRGTILYGDVEIGDDFQTGHFALVREQTRIGDRVVLGTHAVIDGHTEIGSHVKLETRVYIPTHAVIGSHVFIGPGAVLTNDKYPQRLRDEYEPRGPVLEDGVTLGAGAIVLPGVRIGKGSFVAAGAVVTCDVPPWSLVRGNPGRIEPLPEKLKEMNRAKNS